MKEMIREIIRDYLSPSDIREAVEKHVIEQLDEIDMDELAEAVIDDIDIFDEAVLVAVEMLLPF